MKTNVRGGKQYLELTSILEKTAVRSMVIDPQICYRYDLGILVELGPFEDDSDSLEALKQLINLEAKKLDTSEARRNKLSKLYWYW